MAIVGCGLIGKKRAGALAGGQLRACADIAIERAEAMAAPLGALATVDWRCAVERSDVDIVVVATINESLAEVAVGALVAGKHVLIEKPAARSLAELAAIEAAAGDRLVRVGFNHRYHPAFEKAREIVDRGELGDLMFLRARYGHGGRPGYDREWRADPARSGGGELIDQGVHLIDLARWFLGDFTEVDGFAHTYYWPMPVDDNAFLTLKTAHRQVAFLHVSCTEWKNLFSFELYGRDGKLQVDGLGGSYGVERLAFYKMLPQMGPPETTIWEYPMGDRSWEIEMAEFLEDVHLGRQPCPGLAEARATLAVVDQVYWASGYAHD